MLFVSERGANQFVFFQSVCKAIYVIKIIDIYFFRLYITGLEINNMKVIKLLLCFFLGSALGAKYYPAVSPLNSVGKVQEKIDALSPVAGTSLAVPMIDGTGWELKQCSAKSDIKAALEKDTEALPGSVDGAKKGSCCINAHHEACILLQAQIRSCGHKGKGDDSVSSNATNCPQ